jgi:hypothetical protein
MPDGVIYKTLKSLLNLNMLLLNPIKSEKFSRQGEKFSQRGIPRNIGG